MRRRRRRRKTQPNNLVIRLAAVLFCLVMITTYLTSGLYARYTAGASGNDQARVAMFEINENVEERVEAVVLEGMKPGMSKTFSFEVSNYSDAGTSEVELGYEFSIERTDVNDPEVALPLDISVASEATVGEGTLAGRQQFKWKGGLMPANEETVHKYTVTVSWDGDRKDAFYSEEIDMLVITLKSEQID